MSLFGWSLPPGCGRLPGEEPFFCELCGALSEEKCVCPLCPQCDECGNPNCYKSETCGLVKTEEQIKQLGEFEKEWDERRAAEIEVEKLFKAYPEEEW